MFPQERPRRLRQATWLRDLVRETDLTRRHLIAPLFAVPGRGVRREIPSLPGQFHLSADSLLEKARGLQAAGVPAVLLFAQDSPKDPVGSGADRPGGVALTAIRALKDALGDSLGVIADVCLCAYTESGHCGLTDERGGVDNDRSVERLAQVAVAYARAGADAVAPSDMMDGRVGAIRRELDAAGLGRTLILSYAVKYASAFYGPFREAVNSAPRWGDRKGYQMDPANAREAMREIALDLSEGADLVMVKPALAYLDVLREVRSRFPVPLVAYSTSGEYACVVAAARAGWIDERQAALEVLTAIRRAGADAICTYWAEAACGWLP